VARGYRRPATAAAAEAAEVDSRSTKGAGARARDRTPIASSPFSGWRASLGTREQKAPALTSPADRTIASCPFGGGRRVGVRR